MESSGGQQACERALFSLAGNQATHECAGDQRDYSDLPGGFFGHSPIAISPADDSPLSPIAFSPADDSPRDVHGNEHCGSAARYPRAAETETPGSAQSGVGGAPAGAGRESRDAQAD